MIGIIEKSLLDAIYSGDQQTVIDLTITVDDVNYCSGAMSPLIAVASMGMLELVQSLIKRGDEPDARPVVDQTALYRAAEHGQIDIVKYLSPCIQKKNFFGFM